MAEIRRQDGIVEFNGYTGLRNTVLPESFDDGDLNVAQNVDLDNSKRLMRRRGITLLAGGAFSSLKGDGSGLLFAVSGGTSLVQVFPDGTTSALRSNLISGLELDYSFTVGRTYYSNGIQNGIVERGLNRTWGLTRPANQGTATQVGGQLRDGDYQWCVVFHRNDGQLSGTGLAGKITLSSTGPITNPAPAATANQGGIRFTGLPVSPDSSVSTLEIYITDFNGETFYRRGSIANGQTTFTYDRQFNSQVPLRTQFLNAPPAGKPIMYAHGRAFVAVDRNLFFSEPFAPELFDYRKAIPFESPVTVIAPAADGMYIGTEQNVSWHAGRNPEDWVYLRKTTYGAIRGTLSFAPADWFEPKGDGDAAVFMTQLGLCVGQNGGQLSNLTQEKFLFPNQERGTTIARKYRGYNQVLAFMQGAETAAPSAS